LTPGRTLFCYEERTFDEKRDRFIDDKKLTPKTFRRQLSVDRRLTLQGRKVSISSFSTKSVNETETKKFAC
jgi:hypothetical protein